VTWRSVLRLLIAFEQVCETGEGGKGRRPILLPAWRCFSHLIPLMLIVVTVEAEQLPITSVRRIVIMVVVFVMDRELAEFLSVKFSSAVGTDPRKEFERAFAE